MSLVAPAIDPVTARWSTALFNLAQRRGVLDEVAGDVERLGAELASPAVRDYLLGARSSEERISKLGRLLADFHPLSRNFVRMAFARNREEVLLGVAAAFRRRSLEERGAVEGVVESPRALGSAALGRLADHLGRRLQRQVHLTNRVNEDLVAGVRIFVGTRMIDQSVQGRLEGLHRRLKETSLR